MDCFASLAMTELGMLDTHKAGSYGPPSAGTGVGA
jgi:hypothetical protein